MRKTKKRLSPISARNLVPDSLGSKCREVIFLFLLQRDLILDRRTTSGFYAFLA
ncbi:hypothetical protein WN55_10158 [Dufourea novaeangliae]|uniref:Uncharacterized protein n=1 Tax=Dufourea novaeangliae TaxID=178035 RepID=A0A154P2T1_DUFNO|nr:hypothetical protein WN55_10158 [Dufourea novaeangliae]